MNDKIKRSLAKMFLKTKANFTNPANFAEAILVQGIDKKDVLFAKNINKSLPVGSLTKIMTTFVVLNNTKDINAQITVNKDAEKFNGEEYSHVNLKENDVFPVKDLLIQTMVASACDSSFMLAGNSEEERKNFYDKMNEEAKNLFLYHSHYNDSVGYSMENKMSASNVFTLTKSLIEKFPESFDEITPSSFECKEVEYNSTSPQFNRKEVKGIKTGFLKKAGRSIVLKVYDEKTDQDYLIIIIGAKRLIYRDFLIEYLVRKFFYDDFKVYI